MVEQYEATTEAVQESPSVEESQLQEETQGVETEEAPIQDKNWKAVRERLDQLEKENSSLKEKEQESPMMRSKGDLLEGAVLSTDEVAELSKAEVKAELKFPELETKNIFSKAVFGEYRAALDDYVRLKSAGGNPRLPSAYEIAKQVKQEYDTSLGSVSKKSEEEGAKKAKQSVESRESTVEAEGRSDRGKVAGDRAELGKLQQRSREGDLGAIAERISRSGL